MVPRAVNGSTMQPLRKLPINITLNNCQLNEEFHIYPQVSGVLLSWQVAKRLHILPAHYPKPACPQDPPQVAAIGVLSPGDIRNEYPMVFDGIVKSMEGEYFHIALMDDAKPFCVRTPRTIPFCDKLKAELDLLQEQNIIAPVTEPTDWCAPIVVTPKKGTEKIRMCVDLSHLNKYVKRARYQCSTPAEAVEADITSHNAKVFTKLDALKGYHQCPLDEDSQLLTTFITPFGRFKYLRAPYGISSISEHYNRRMDEAFSGLTGYRRVVDDILIYDSDSTLHAEHVRQFLLRCAERRITLNQDKWECAQPRVTFAGFNLSKDGYSIDSAITYAIAKFPTPPIAPIYVPSSDWLTNWQLALTHSRDYLNHYDRCSAPKMSLYGHQIMSKHSKRQRRPSHQPPHSSSLTHRNLRAFALMQSTRIRFCSPAEKL